MATVRQRRSGRWQVIVQARQPDGSRRQESRMFDREEDARLYAHRLEYDVRSGQLTADRATVRQLCDLWLDVNADQKPTTLTAYRQALALACRHLANTEARRLTAIQCEQAWARLLRTHSPTYVRQARSTLSQVFSWAAIGGIVTHNPAAVSRVRTTRQRGTLDEPSVLTQQELAAVLNHPQAAPWPTLWRLLADTGLRQGEARALHWKHVDLDAGTIRVDGTRTIGADGREIDGPPKSQQSKRRIQLTSQAHEALAAHRAAVASELGLPAVAKKAHVFYGPPSRGQTNKVWRDLRAAIDLPEHLTPHSLRHTFASTMLAEGVPLVRVAALCGHTVDVCARTYAHWIGGVDSEAAQVLERSRRLRAAE